MDKIKVKCNRCQDTKVITLRFEAGNDTREMEVPCECINDNLFRFTDPFEYPSFQDQRPIPIG